MDYRGEQEWLVEVSAFLGPFLFPVACLIASAVMCFGVRFLLEAIDRYERGGP